MALIDLTEPWLVEVKPGQWVTATTEDLLVSIGMAAEQGSLSLERVKSAVDLLLKEGKIRPNPSQTRIEEVGS